MAAAWYSLCCLHTRQDLIDSCAEVLQVFWPQTKTERLYKMETDRCNGLPCSLILIEHRENAADSVIGHIRVVPVTYPESPKSVYYEALCIEESKRGCGLSKKLMSMAEKYSVDTLGCEQAFVWLYPDMASFYKPLSYREHSPGLRVRTTGCNMLGHTGASLMRSDNAAPPGLEDAYDGTVWPEERQRGLIMMKKELK